jgi:hypothetical protein
MADNGICEDVFGQDMEEHERKLLEDTLSNLSASMGNALREGFETEEVLSDRDGLSEHGVMWVKGYLVGQLAMIRGGSVGNPNVSEADVTEVSNLVEKHGGQIASEVYS